VLSQHKRPRLCALLAVALAAAALVPAAVADGDPASDYLLQQDTFTPYPPPPAAAVAALDAAVAAVWAHGDRLKVAVVATPQDLGAVPSLFGRPADYARFLGTELEFVYRGPLLIAMPDGYGFVRDATPDASATPVLDRQQTAQDAASLTTDATGAVRALEQAGLLHVKDVTKPTVSVQPLQARRGRRVFLRYVVVDDSRSARVTVTVRNRTRAIKVFNVPFQRAVLGTAHGVVWRVPRTAPALLALCVRAADRAGNRSRETCADLTVS
jgi:hypothetical protein